MAASTEVPSFLARIYASDRDRVYCSLLLAAGEPTGNVVHLATAVRDLASAGPLDFAAIQHGGGPLEMRIATSRGTQLSCTEANAGVVRDLVDLCGASGLDPRNETARRIARGVLVETMTLPKAQVLTSAIAVSPEDIPESLFDSEVLDPRTARLLSECVLRVIPAGAGPSGEWPYVALPRNHDLREGLAVRLLTDKPEASDGIAALIVLERASGTMRWSAETLAQLRGTTVPMPRLLAQVLDGNRPVLDAAQLLIPETRATGAAPKKPNPGTAAAGVLETLREAWPEFTPESKFDCKNPRPAVGHLRNLGTEIDSAKDARSRGVKDAFGAKGYRLVKPPDAE
jgi:hypothetical protein